MNGVPKAMFLPLSLSIAFAMIISYVAAQTLVPVISNWFLKEEMFQYHHKTFHAHAGLALDEKEIEEVDEHTKEDKKHLEEDSFFQKMKLRLANTLNKWMPNRKWIAIIYLIIAFSVA